MQVEGALQGGASTRPQHSRLHLLVAIVVIAAMVALLVQAAPLVTNGVGAEDANPNAGAGSAVIHDDAWNMPRNADPAVVYGDGSNLHAST